MLSQHRRYCSFFSSIVLLYYTQRLASQNIVSRITEFKLETLLFGDKNLDNEDNITIILAVHDHITDSERF